MHTRGPRMEVAEAVSFVAVAAVAAIDARREDKVQVGTRLHHGGKAVFGRNNVELSQRKEYDGGVDGTRVLQLL